MMTWSPEGRAQMLLERETEPPLELGVEADRQPKRGFSSIQGRAVRVGR